MISLDIALPLLARLLLVILFPFSALDKILGWNAALKQANSSFLPGGSALLVIAIIVELVMPICIVLAWHDRMAAFVLAGFCVLTALLYHEFWRYGDFWARGESQSRNHFWDFLKNFGLVGGLLMVVFGTHLAPLNAFVSHPLSSTPVYTSEPAIGEGPLLPSHSLVNSAGAEPAVLILAFGLRGATNASNRSSC